MGVALLLTLVVALIVTLAMRQAMPLTVLVVRMMVRRTVIFGPLGKAKDVDVMMTLRTLNQRTGVVKYATTFRIRSGRRSRRRVAVGADVGRRSHFEDVLWLRSKSLTQKMR